MESDQDFSLWKKEMSRYRSNKRAARIGILGVGALVATPFIALANADTMTNRVPVQEVSVAIIPSDYNKSSSLITGLTPLSITGAERVVAEIGCSNSGEVIYTLLSGYNAPEGATSKVNTTLSELPNPCDDYNITIDEKNMVLAIAEKVGITTYVKN